MMQLFDVPDEYFDSTPAFASAVILSLILSVSVGGFVEYGISAAFGIYDNVAIAYAISFVASGVVAISVITWAIKSPPSFFWMAFRFPGAVYYNHHLRQMVAETSK